MLFNCKKRIVTLLLLFTVSALYASPRGRNELVRPGSWIYDSLTAISLEEGRTDFSDDAPLTLGEISILLDEADYDNLSEEAQCS